ncbi:MAG: hypothetical protein V1809_00260 [Planctomycetota bacterium]
MKRFWEAAERSYPNGMSLEAWFKPFFEAKTEPDGEYKGTFKEVLAVELVNRHLRPGKCLSPRSKDGMLGKLKEMILATRPIPDRTRKKGDVS